MRYASWEKLVERLKEFEGKKIDELSIKEIEEYLELRKQCNEIASSIGKLMGEFCNGLKKVLKNV